VTQGASGSTTLTATLNTGVTQAVSFSASGLPSGATATLATPSCAPTCTSLLTIATSASTPLGTFPITVTGSPFSKTTTFNLVLTTPANAVYDPILKAPKCATVGSDCDTGTLLLNGRDTLLGGTEPHQPNTIANACPDGTLGTYHDDESIDRLRVSTV